MQERKIHLAHQAMMLNDANQLLAINRQQVKTHGRMLCDLPELPEDTMGIHIGDVNVTPPAPKSGLGSLAKLLMAIAAGAGLLGTGGAGALSLASLLRPGMPVITPAEPIDVEVPWEWKDGKMHFGTPKATKDDMARPAKIG